VNTVVDERRGVRWYHQLAGGILVARPKTAYTAAGPLIVPVDRLRFRQARFFERIPLPRWLSRALRGKEITLTTSLTSEECMLRLWEQSSCSGALSYMDNVYGIAGPTGFALQTYKSALLQGTFAPVAYGRYENGPAAQTKIVVRIAQPCQPLLAHTVLWLVSFFYWLLLAAGFFRDITLLSRLQWQFGAPALIWWGYRLAKGFWWIDAIDDAQVIPFLMRALDAEPE
jgi:hypothetical protein